MKYVHKGNRINVHIDSLFSGKTLLDFLSFYKLNKTRRYLLLQKKLLLLNGETVINTDVILKSGDIITIFLEEQEPDFRPAQKECRVVYEDDFVYVAHKEAGIIIHDEESNEALANQAALYQINHGIKAPVRFLHRLDRETSGLVLFCKIPFFQAYFDDLLEHKKITRRYLAITTGQGKENDAFTFRQPIGRNRHIANQYIVTPNGREAVTRAKIIDTHGRYLLIRCLLETGRTHQIRVHLAYNGFPIVNDPFYGVMSKDFQEMGLWAYEMTFPNPLNFRSITVRDILNPDYSMFTKKG